MTENLREVLALIGILTVFLWHGIILFLPAEPKFSQKSITAIVGAAMTHFGFQHILLKTVFVQFARGQRWHKKKKAAKPRAVFFSNKRFCEAKFRTKSEKRLRGDCRFAAVFWACPFWTPKRQRDPGQSPEYHNLIIYMFFKNICFLKTTTRYCN